MLSDALNRLVSFLWGERACDRRLQSLHSMTSVTTEAQTLLSHPVHRLGLFSSHMNEASIKEGEVVNESGSRDNASQDALASTSTVSRSVDEQGLNKKTNAVDVSSNQEETHPSSVKRHQKSSPKKSSRRKKKRMIEWCEASGDDSRFMPTPVRMN